MTSLRYHSRTQKVVQNAGCWPRLSTIFTILPLLPAIILTSCGQEDLPNLPERVADALVFPTHDEIREGQALGSSYIVTFRAEGSGDLLNFASYQSEYQSHFLPLFENVIADTRVENIQFITAADLSPPAQSKKDLQNSGDLSFGMPLGVRQAWMKMPSVGAPVGSITRVDFKDPFSAVAVLKEWANSGRIWFAEPNYISHTSKVQDSQITSLDKLADAYDLLAQSQYWWLRTTQISAAFRDIHSSLGGGADTLTTSTRPIIAVLDSGVDYDHPVFADGRIWENTKVGVANCSGDLHGCNTTAADRGKLGNGDVYPYDTSGPGESCTDKDSNCSHGTHVAGIIAGNYDWKSSSGQRVAGICPMCQIMIVKIVSRVGNQSGILDSSILAGFKYVTLFDHGDESAVRVINASFGKFVRSRSVGLLVRLMKEKRGMLLIGAAGNEDTLRMEYPAAFSDAVAVAAVDRELKKVAFSNFGRWVDISAPGQAILSSVPGAALDSKSGTSMAAPFVTGVAGLMIAANPNISYHDLRTWLLDSADPSFYSENNNDAFNYTYYYRPVDDSKLRQPLLGKGVLNANQAILQKPATGLPVFSGTDRVRPGCSVVRQKSNNNYWTVMFLSLVPFIFIYRRQVIRTMLRKRRSEPI